MLPKSQTNYKNDLLDHREIERTMLAPGCIRRDWQYSGRYGIVQLVAVCQSRIERGFRKHLIRFLQLQEEEQQRFHKQ